MTHTDHKFTSASHWNNAQPVAGIGYGCGYCGAGIASGTGYMTDHGHGIIRLCPQCNGPTFFGVDGSQWPGAKVGGVVGHLPSDVQAIYEEARNSIPANAPTASVMLCRKILMHVAVEKGAEKNLKFQEYVGWLLAEHYAPKGSEGWIDYIRRRANYANHEIVVMEKADATGVLRFTEALLRNVYELPALVPNSKANEHTAEPDSGTPERGPE